MCGTRSCATVEPSSIGRVLTPAVGPSCHQSPHAAVCLSLSPPTPPPTHTQVGSQHRKKAEPAGAVTGDKWVPKEGHVTLTSPPNKPYCRNLDDPPPAQPAA